MLRVVLKQTCWSEKTVQDRLHCYYTVVKGERETELHQRRLFTLSRF